MKKLMAIILASIMVLSFAACGGSDKTYEDIYNEYSAKLEEAAPTLLEEYETEAAELGGDLTALSELCDEKVGELAKIEAEGTKEMASLKAKNGDSNDVYEEWAEKLYDVYEEQASLIQDAYMDSAS